jgi:DMSO/TMAO reductase YedYZ molybdopterin-dependent catalytic subunit
MISRRQFIKDTGLVLLGTAMGYTALNTSCKKGNNPISTTQPPDTDLAYLINVDPSTVDNQNLPITPLNGLHVNGYDGPGFVDITTFTLSIYGMVDNPLDITYEMFKKYERVTQVTLLSCPNEFVDNAQWSGVPVSALLTSAGVKPEAQNVLFHSMPGDTRPVLIADAMAKGVLLADEVDGVPLPISHGFPLRLVRPGLEGGNWLKWVTRIELA